ncbi:MAG: phosphonate ABC transporter, permease protein PhnE [Chloroflexota bacterium]
MNSDKRKIDTQKEIKPSLVSPFLAAILSAVIPGLGQALSRAVQRGLVLALGFFTSAGLLIWRFTQTARRDVGFVDIFKKAIRLEPILLVLLIATLILWIWIISDAYKQAKRPQGRAVGLFFILIMVFFGIGWQVGEVDAYKFFSELSQAKGMMSEVAWPWAKATTTPMEYHRPGFRIQVPCSGETLEDIDSSEGEPYILSTPDCGNLAEIDGTLGSELTLVGGNFTPGEEVTIVWNDPLKVEFNHRVEGKILRVIPDENGSFEVDITMPYRLVPPSAGEGTQIWEVFGKQIASIGKPVASEELKLAVEKIIETIFIGMMATAFGIVLALPFSFLAARNLMSGSWVTVAIYFLVRTFLNIVRSIEPLIWAIIFVLVVGLGPFAGILALSIHSIAALGKLYSESIESIDPGPIEAVQATGANWVQTIAFAVVPQIIPPFVSFTIYRWDINIRMSTIIGFVGGGGIGYLLSQWINKTDFEAAGIAVWFIAVTVAILDYVSAEIRKRFV